MNKSVFCPTHRITLPSGVVEEVMLIDGAGYTQAEWESETQADYERTAAGEWTFYGQPFAGSVECIKDAIEMTVCDSIDPSLATLLQHGAACVRVARRDKFPIGKAWHTLATTVADVIAEWLDRGDNVGILLGTGNLIDVEYDDDAGRQQLDAMGLAGIRTPTWASGRGEHRLFRLADPLPPRGWIKRGGLEIRLGGKPAQSVLPPSLHPSGRRYGWTTSPAECEPATVTLAQLGVHA